MGVTACGPTRSHASMQWLGSSQEGTRLCSSLVVAPDIDKDAGADDDWVLNVHSCRDRRGNGNGSDNGDCGYDDEDYEPPARMNRRCDPLDEKHLLA